MAETEELTFTVSGDEDEATVTLPAALVDALSEGGESDAEVVADISLMAFVQRAHTLAHHAEGEPPAELVDAEERARELFEERFGLSYEEATGHSH